MTTPSVAVLLSSYNGEKFIYDQIDSILKQIDVNIDLFIRDDGSKDRTCEIIESFASDHIHLTKGYNVGVINSFFELISNVKGYDYYALCDQDDVWDFDKLIIAIKSIQNHISLPSMYFSSTRVVDEDLKVLEAKSSTIKDGALDPVRVIIGNNATGCTMVFNDKLHHLLTKGIPSKVIMHDHWIYLLCVLCGGYVFYDPNPHISYRQHGNNEMGNKISFRKKIKLSSLNSGKMIRSGICKQLYNNYFDNITNENKNLVFCAANYKDKFKTRKSLLSFVLSSNLKFKRKTITLIEILIGVF